MPVRKMRSRAREEDVIGASTPGLKSSHLKTPAHTLIRVRNNQRLHRQRRREYIASLEERVKELEGLLAHAQEEISALQTKLEQWNGSRDDVMEEQAAASKLLSLNSPGVSAANQFWTRIEPTAKVDHHPPETADGAEPIPTAMTNEYEHSIVASAVTLDSISVVDTLSGTKDATIHAPDMSIMHTADSYPSSPITSYQSSFDPSRGACPSSCRLPEPVTLPASAVAAHELMEDDYQPLSLVREDYGSHDDASTTSCTRAYILIAEQNFRGLDEQSIKERLCVGFRKARNQSEGCRVQNNVLLGLLDFIS